MVDQSVVVIVVKPYAKYPSNGITYSQICGRVVGYQYTSPDAADNQCQYHSWVSSTTCLDFNGWSVPVTK